VITAYRLADRITLELNVPGQARPLEMDFVATPDVSTPAPGARSAAAFALSGVSA
jgi:sulfate transport system ATP-binding protein